MNKSIFILTTILSLVFGAVGGGLSTWALWTYTDLASSESTGQTIINYDATSYYEVWEQASPSVVSVVALKDLSQYYNQFSFFGAPNIGQEAQGSGELSQISSGTGFIITPDGLVLTNKHVVEDESASYVVILDDGTELEAEVLDKDPLNDIALLRITGEYGRLGDLPSLEFADSDTIRVGDPVVAIGNALGEYSNTTTVGIISATGRQIVASSGYGASENLVNLIQTDAAINPGNSGGPLLNLAGEVVGMNTAIDTTAEGIGFALPSNDIASVVGSYQEFGRIVRPFVGVSYVPVNPQIQKRFNLGVDHGAYIVGDQKAGVSGVVDGSPADEAGLQNGDVLLSVNGKDLTNTFTLPNAIAGYLVGDTVTLEIYRDGKTFSVELTLAENTY